MRAASNHRGLTIRGRMRRVVAIPMAVLLVVWLAVSGWLFAGAVMQTALSDATEDLLVPASLALTSVMDERSATVGYLAQPERYESEMREVRDTVDESMTEVLDGFEGWRPFLDGRAQERLTDLSERFGELTELRDAVDSERIDRDTAVAGYSALTRAGADLFEETARSGNDPPAVVAGLTATDLFRAVDHLSLADAQLSESFAGADLSLADQDEFARAMGTFHSELDTIGEFLGDEQASALRALEDSNAWESLTRLEREVTEREIAVEVDPLTGEVEQDAGLPIEQDEWKSAFDAVKTELTDIGASQANHSIDVSRDTATNLMTVAFGVSVGIFVVFALALGVARQIGHTITDRLSALRDQVHALADERLPDIVRRLGKGDRVDVEAELAELDDDGDEIGDVARSFNNAQRVAVEAAVRQSEIRHGANRMFVNVAHRSQTLAHRQLRLLDRMEREQEEPQQLTDLFKLDHFATRSRRHAENLLILGGENPGTRRNAPLTLMDVVRAAISESGDYTRVERQRIAQRSLRGTAAADTIHLLAELLDNATSFSPPHTRVRVGADHVPKGVVVEVEDRGIGMTEEEFERANQLLATAPEFDVLRLDDQLRLGLFVVSWLAHRHGIQVTLRTSAYGGVLAVVLLPAEILEGEGPPALEGSAADTAESATVVGDSDGDALVTLSTAVDTAPTTLDATPAPDRTADGDTTGGGAGTGSAPTAGTGAGTGASAASPADAGGPASAGRRQLPRRTPQASLAPQLRAESDTANGVNTGPNQVAHVTNTATNTAADALSVAPAPQRETTRPGGAASDTDDDSARLERIRSMLTAFQQGSQRGRAGLQQGERDESTGEDA